jgi:hypothetical protein
MFPAAVIVSALSMVTPATAGRTGSLAEEPQARWSLSTEADAERVVTLEVLSGRRVASSWRFPVKLQPPAAHGTEAGPVSRSFRVVDPAGGTKDINVFSETWLGGIDDATAFVSFEWYPTKDKDGETRILKDIVDVAYGKTESLDVGNGVRIRASYRGTSKDRP